MKRRLVGRHIKSIIVGASVAIIAAGMVHLAFSFLNSSDMSRSGPDGFKARDPAMSPRPMPSGTVGCGFVRCTQRSATVHSAVNPSAGVLPQPPVTSALDYSGCAAASCTNPDRSSAAPPPSAAPVADVTGALDNQASAVVNAPLALTPVAPQGGGRAPSLPAAIGSKTLIAARARMAMFQRSAEGATRYSDGRSVPLNPGAAAIWFERASNGGWCPPPSVWAGFMKKASGSRKTSTRRAIFTPRLPIAAVPRRCTTWPYCMQTASTASRTMLPRSSGSRKAGARGVPDSQYNLGVLYARGIGVEANFGESYRWFALAAQSGDQDAAQKRDDVAKRLDASTLSAVRAAVQSWTLEPQPDDAVTVKAPPGGWDPSAPAAAPKGKQSACDPGASRIAVCFKKTRFCKKIFIALVA